TLTRYAEVVHDSLNDMRGATAPRLLLEVMCARLLLPAASEDASALLQRIERLESGAGPAGREAGGSARAASSAGAEDSSGAAEPAPRFVRPSQRRAQEAAASVASVSEPAKEQAAAAEPDRAA